MNIYPKGTPPRDPRDASRSDLRGDPPVGPSEPGRRERHRADHALAEEAQGAGEDGEFRFADVLRTLWAHKWSLATMTLLGMGLAWLYVSTETPRYTATARVVLETSREQVLNFESVVPRMSTDYTAMNTEVLNLRSQTLMAQVVDALDLTEDPEFNPHLRAPPEWKETIGYNDLMAALGRAPEPRPAPEPAQARATAAAILGGKVEVSIVPSTYAFDVDVETQAARKSAVQRKHRNLHREPAADQVPGGERRLGMARRARRRAQGGAGGGREPGEGVLGRSRSARRGHRRRELAAAQEHARAPG